MFLEVGLIKVIKIALNKKLFYPKGLLLFTIKGSIYETKPALLIRFVHAAFIFLC